MLPSKYEPKHDFTPKDFAPRGTIKLADGVLDRARQFQSELQRYDSNAQWIVAFTWCYKRSMRKKGETEYIDEAPGLDLAGYRSTELPDYAVELRDGVRLAFIIRHDIFEAAKEKKVIEVRLASGRDSFDLA